MTEALTPVAELVMTPEDDLQRTKRVGKTSMDKIKEEVGELGFRLGTTFYDRSSRRELSSE